MNFGKIIANLKNVHGFEKTSRIKESSRIWKKMNLKNIHGLNKVCRFKKNYDFENSSWVLEKTS